MILAVIVFLLALAALSLSQGWRHVGRRPRRRRGYTRRPRPAPRRQRRPTPVGHDQWTRPGPYRKPRPRPGCDVYVYWRWNATGDGPDRSGRGGYAGKALDWRERVPAHCKKAWWPEVYPVPDVQRVTSERAALDREWYLIGELDCEFNIRKPGRWVRTGRPTAEVMQGFRLAASGQARRSSYGTRSTTRRPSRWGTSARRASRAYAHRY